MSFVNRHSMDVIRRLNQLGQHHDHERRKRLRYRACFRITVVPCDRNGDAIGSGFQALARDLSSSGMSIMYSRPAPSEYLQVEIGTDSGPGLRLMAKVVRSRPAGMFYETGVCFLARSDTGADFPAPPGGNAAAS